MLAWSIAKADENHRHTLTFHFIQNILAPVHRPPPEIPLRIFIEAWKDWKSLRLTHVCPLWRTIFLEISQFWAVAIAGDQFRLPSNGREVSYEDYFAIACTRSAPRNISVRLSSMSTRGYFELIHHENRITSIQISAQTLDQLELLWNMLHAGMPRLEHLAVSAPTSIRGWAVPSKLSTEELPRLTKLSIPARFLSRSWPNTLQQIALGLDNEYSFFTDVSLEMVLRILEPFPKLGVLDVRDNELFHNPQIQSSSRAFAMLEVRVSARLGVAQFQQDIRLFARTGALVSCLLLAQRTPMIFEGRLFFSAFPHLIHLALHTRSGVCAALLEALYPPYIPSPSSGPASESKFARGPALLPLLQDLTVGFATKRRSEISRELRRVHSSITQRRRSDCSAVVTHFRACCELLCGFLYARRKRGYCLSRLEFFSYEEGRVPAESGLQAVWRVDLAVLYGGLVEHQITPIWGWVDGPVVFSGYRFFTEA